jgi:hypothetical protein
MERFKFYVFSLKPMGLNEENQVTNVDTGLINMFKVLDCLVEEFIIEEKPVGYTTLKECTEERGLRNSRYIYSALRRARAMGFVKFIERKSGGAWRLYAPTMRGIIANYAFNLAFEYEVPELYGLIMEYAMMSLRMTVKVLRKWRELIDKEGINYNRNYIESVIRINELMLSAFKEDTPSNPEELLMVMKYLRESMDITFYNWFGRGLVVHLTAAGVPEEAVQKIIRPTPDELHEFYGSSEKFMEKLSRKLMSESRDVTTNQQAQDPQTQP